MFQVLAAVVLEDSRLWDMTPFRLAVAVPDVSKNHSVLIHKSEQSKIQLGCIVLW